MLRIFIAVLQIVDLAVNVTNPNVFNMFAAEIKMLGCVGQFQYILDSGRIVDTQPDPYMFYRLIVAVMPLAITG